MVTNRKHSLDGIIGNEILFFLFVEVLSVLCYGIRYINYEPIPLLPYIFCIFLLIETTYAGYCLCLKKKLSLLQVSSESERRHFLVTYTLVAILMSLLMILSWFFSIFFLSFMPDPKVEAPEWVEFLLCGGMMAFLCVFAVIAALRNCRSKKEDTPVGQAEDSSVVKTKKLGGFIKGFIAIVVLLQFGLFLQLIFSIEDDGGLKLQRYYDSQTIRSGDFSCVVSDSGKECFIETYYWNGDTSNMDIYIPAFCDGVSVTKVGGYIGKGYPCPFHVAMPKEYEPLNDSTVTGTKLVFTVHVGDKAEVVKAHGDSFQKDGEIYVVTFQYE